MNELEEAVLTDDIETTADKITITNPRWKHSVPEKQESSPDMTKIDDVITLFVDVSGYPNGGRVTFDIYDVTSDPPLRVETVSGKNDNGTASAEWTVADPLENEEDLKLVFEGIAKSKASERAEIPVSIGGYFFSC